MKRILVTLCLLILTTVTLKPHQGFAACLSTYLIQSPECRGTDPTYPRNDVVFQWAGYNSHLYWWAEYGLRNDVLTALSKWASSTAIPRLCSQKYPSPRCLLIEVDHQSEADLLFQFNPNLPLDTPGRTTRTCAQDGTRQGCYSASWLVSIRETAIPPYGSGARVAVIAHEFGHVLGLGEQYTSSSCGSAFSLMDGLQIVSNQVVQCDATNGGPASLDVSNFDNFWQYGYLSDWSVATVGSFVVTWYWKDYAWAEHSHLMRIEYYNSGTGQYDRVSQVSVIDQIGSHRTINDRTMQLTFSNLLSGRGPGTYRLCGRLDSPAVFGSTIETCSPTVFLS